MMDAIRPVEVRHMSASRVPDPVPDVLPMLARGKHRNPRRGACFMELASYLAGEPWTDSPACTDESLAHLARLVNDFTPDAHRPALAPLIPSVIGLRDLGPGFEDEVALVAAMHALPVASMDRQRGLAVGMLRTLGQVDAYRTRATAEMTRAAAKVLDDHADAKRWGLAFAARMGSGPVHQSSAQVIVEVAVRGIAEACVPDPATRLRTLLAEVIELARRRAGLATTEPPPLSAHQWRAAVTAAR